MTRYMKVFKILILVFGLSVIGCNDDDPMVNCKSSDGSEMKEIECAMYDDNSLGSRSYYGQNDGANVYSARWSADDQIAICFDDSENARQFNLLRGENSFYATFYGPVPDQYNRMVAIYPSEIYKGRSSNSIEVFLPAEISYDANKILSGAMPMFARGGSMGTLTFYNLMGAIKISISGSGLLKSVTVSSKDGYGLSGEGHVTVNEDGIPELLLEKNNKHIQINTGSVFLSTKPIDIFLPVPAMKYENGLKLDFNFEGRTETRDLNGALIFERSVMRPVKLYEISVPFNFDSYEPKDNEIWYKANTPVPHSNESVLGFAVISHSYSDNEQLGVYTAQSQIVKIGGPLFESPDAISYVRLPNTVQEIAMRGFKGTSIESFEAPTDLRILGTDAFLGCANLKRIVLNDGLESCGLEAFGSCPNLEYVYLPKTLKTIGAYAFIRSTSNLDHWDGDCPLVDEDRHTLYANSAYGMVSEQLDQIDNVAGCNLSEYSIPKKALSTQNYALSGLKNLKKLIIHDKFRHFGLEVFSVLNNLESIICYAENPPSFNSDEIFKSVSLKEIKVPKQCIDKYKSAYGWAEFSDKIIPL